MKKLLFLPMILLVLILTGCTGQSTDADFNPDTTAEVYADANYTKQSSGAPFDIQKAKIGVMTGTTGEKYTLENYPNENVSAYDEVMDAVAAMIAGKVDAVITADVTAMNIANHNPDFEVMGVPMTNENVAAGIAKENTELLASIDSIISELETDGTLADMKARWVKSDGSAYEPASIKAATGEVLHVGVAATREPFSFRNEDGEIIGYAPELAYRIGEKLGRKIEFVDLKFGALISSLQSGKIDVIVDLMSATDERKEQINFTRPYYISGQVILKRTDNSTPDNSSVFRAEDFVGKRIAVLSGSAFDNIIKENIPGAETAYYNSVGDTITAVRTGKVDALMMDDAELKLIVAQNPELKLLMPLVTDNEYAVVLGKGNTELKAQLDAFIGQIMEDGTHDDMLRRWLDEAGEKPMPDIPVGNGETITFATASLAAGFSYMKDGELTGLDIEFARRFAAHLDRKLEIMTFDFSGVLPAVQSGKADFAASLIIVTEERKKNVDFSIPYYIGGTGLCALKSAEELSSVFLAEDFEGQTFAVWTGTISDQIVEQRIKDAKLLYYNTPQEYVEAVRTDKADAAMHDEPIIRKYIAGYPELKILYPYVTRDEYGVVFDKQSTGLRDSFNLFLREIKDNGVYDDIVHRWVDTAVSPAMPAIPLTGENGTLVFGTTGLDEPFSYIQDGEPAGFDVELAYRFAQYMGMQLDITLMDFGALIPAVQSGKVDFAGDLLTVTEARKEFIDFSDPTYIGGMVVMVRDKTSVSDTGSFWQGVQKSFYQNLIVESRWKMVVQGLSVTAVISIFSLLLGTMLGFLICFMAMSKLRVINAVSRVYTMLLRGTPMVVLLMIIYYIVFAKVNINPVYVAIIAFGLNGGAFIGEIIRSAILTVDKGQIEAARSMGFSKARAFLTVTLPQAVRVAFPVYKSEFISMVKGTAIVGYIAIMDLTKAGDIIRSRTYDAFFPLIIIAIVYLLTIGAFLWLFNRIESLTDKRTRRDRA